MTTHFEEHLESETEWTQPLPLKLVPLLCWPDGVLPEPFGKFVKELARSTETPIELASMITLASVATVVHRTYRVRVKDDYEEPMCISTLVVLKPGSRKSRVFGEIISPIREWEKEQNLRLQPSIESAKSRLLTLEGCLRDLRTKASKDSK